MRPKAYSRLFGIALGSSLGVIFFTLTFHGSRVIYVEDSNEVIPSDQIRGVPIHFQTIDFNATSHSDDEDIMDVLYRHNDTEHNHDDDGVAKFLYEKITIFCMVTLENNDERLFKFSRALLKERCNHLYYFSLVPNDTLGIIGVNNNNIKDGTSSLATESFRYVGYNFLNMADWYLRLTLRSYVILENMRYHLSAFDPDKLIYFGPESNDYYGQPSLCSEYILSSKALMKFISSLNAFHDPAVSNANACSLRQGLEGRDALRCLKKIDCKTYDSMDELGRSRLHCFHPVIEVNREYPDWFRKTNPHYRSNATGVSDYAISFGNIDSRKQGGIEYFVYHMIPAGIRFDMESLTDET